jgi:hypothetical protein
MAKVSFVVPCYRLAHLLPECVQSILAQTHEDLEILIMDDHSPDNTPDVAQRFDDPRVRYIRNEENLGHLQNYNKGIALSRGTYVWLISADDRLRRPHVVEKYVEVMENRPDVGYVFCPAVGLSDDGETGLLQYSSEGDQDAVFDGRAFLAKLLKGNTIVSASGMVRKQLYERWGAFCLDLPYAGDWYLWCLFALHSNVAYCGEPMVNYREHSLSLTTSILSDPRSVWKDEGITVVWRIKRAVGATEHTWLAEHCLDSLGRQYASSLGRYGMTPEDFEASLAACAATAEEAAQVRRRCVLPAGDHAFTVGDRRRAAMLYSLAVKQSPADAQALLKYLLIQLGGFGDRLRGGLAMFRHGTDPSRP